jgi:hypothetical protein
MTQQSIEQSSGTLPMVPVPMGNVLPGEAPGAFGEYPAGYPEHEVVTGLTADAIARYHEGDVFFPGAQNYVYEPTLERTAIQGMWGRAFLRTPNTFNPFQHPQVYSHPNVKTNGIGGLVAGQLVGQPLLDGIETGGG